MSPPSAGSRTLKRLDMGPELHARMGGAENY